MCKPRKGPSKNNSARNVEKKIHHMELHSWWTHELTGHSPVSLKFCQQTLPKLKYREKKNEKKKAGGGRKYSRTMGQLKRLYICIMGKPEGAENEKGTEGMFEVFEVTHGWELSKLMTKTK